MPRDITVTFDDGSTHVYQGAPDTVTPDEVTARASREFGKTVTALDGGRKTAPAAAPAPAPSAAAPPEAAPPEKLSLTDTAIGAAKNFVPSVGKMVGGVAHTVAHPLNTVTSAVDLLEGGARNLLNKTDAGRAALQWLDAVSVDPKVRDRAIATANAYGGVMKDRYGTAEGFKRAIASDPAGVLADFSMLFGGAGAALGKAGKLAGAAGASDVSNALAKAGAVADVAGKYTNPLAAPMAVAQPAINKISRGAARAAGYTADVLGGKAAEVNAGKIARQAAGNDLAAVQSAYAAAPANQLAIDAGAGKAPPALQAVLNEAERHNPASPGYRAGMSADADNEAVLAKMAGGASQTEAQAAASAGRKAVNEQLAPARERELAAAGEANRVKPALDERAARMAAAAASNVEDVRRFSAAADRAEAWAQSTFPVKGAPRVPGANTRGREVAGQAEQVAQAAADRSLTFGALARDAAERAASLEAHGLRPLTSDSIVSTLVGKLKNPDIGVNPVTSRAIGRVIEMLQDWSTNAGAITPEALYAIRKNGVAGVIEDLTPAGANGTARRAFAQKVMSEVTPLIDNAIEAAGGTGWKQYLADFSAGMNKVEQNVFAAKLLDLYRYNKDKFARVVLGDDPKSVMKNFGPGRSDIRVEMPTQYPMLQRMAESIRQGKQTAKDITAGQTAASDIFAANQLHARIPNFLSPKIAVTNSLIAQLETKVNAATLNVLAKGAQSGKSMNEVMAVLPAIERSKVLKYLANNPQFSALRTGRAGAAMGATNALMNTQNALAPQ